MQVGIPLCKSSLYFDFNDISSKGNYKKVPLTIGEWSDLVEFYCICIYIV